MIEKLGKLALSDEERKAAAEADFFFSNSQLLEDYEDATIDLQHTLIALKRSLNELNLISARMNRGPVNIENELSNRGITQEDLNQRYAEAVARRQNKAAKAADDLQK